MLTVWGVGHLRFELRATEFLPRGTMLQKAVMDLEQRYGGFHVFRIACDSGKAGGVEELRFLEFLEQARKRVERLPAVSGVYSVGFVYALMNQIWVGGGPEAIRIPNRPLLLRMFRFALQAYHSPAMGALQDRKGRVAYLVVRTHALPADSFLRLIRQAVQAVRAVAPKGIQVRGEEGLESVLAAERRLLRSQLISLGLCMVVIFLVCFGLWRSIWLAVGVWGWNLLALGAGTAVAVGLGVSLNVVTVMGWAVALGLLVDDSIHFIEEWRRQGGEEVGSEALVKALEVKGRAIIATSFVLMGGIGLLELSIFSPLKQLGILILFSLGFGLVAVLGGVPWWIARGRSGEQAGKTEKRIRNEAIGNESTDD